MTLDSIAGVRLLDVGSQVSSLEGEILGADEEVGAVRAAGDFLAVLAVAECLRFWNVRGVVGGIERKWRWEVGGGGTLSWGVPV